jgi:hypothetical protein
VSSGSSHPTHLVWDHDPSDAELTQIVGPDYTTTRMRWLEDDERIRVEPKRLSFWRSLLAVVFMCLMITVWPWLLPWLFDKPNTMEPTIYYAVIGFLWLVLVPVCVWVLTHAARSAEVRLPGAVIDKHTRELTLPGSDHVVQPDHIVRFVALRGRLRTSNRIAPYRQLGVVFRDQQQFVFASFARLTTPGRRRSAAARLAAYYDRPLQTLKAGTMVMG